MPSSFQFLHGVDAPPATGITLTAGPITALFEPELGFLRYVRYSGREVIRGVYGAVRDANWGTVTPRVSDLRVCQEETSFTVRFQVECQAGEIQFSWQGTITGDPTGIRYHLNGTAASPFLTNRTGLCLLHPIPGEAEAGCIIERVDGTEEAGRFPDQVSPHQPFRNIRALRREVAPGVMARILFEGDTFEMEDQRNWTDASFKTYSRPLDLPKPYSLAAGESVQQSITVSFCGVSPAIAAEDERVSVRLSSHVVGRLPQIGFGVASHGEPLTARAMELLQALHPAHLRVDLWLASPDWLAALHRAAAEANLLGTRLEGALFVTDDAEAQLIAFRAALDGLRVPVARWLIFQEAARATPDSILELARRTLRDAPIFAPVGGGTNNSFADLNRRPAHSARTDFVAFAVNPQVHAFDDRTLVENLQGQDEAVRSARRLAGRRPVVVSPVTLRPRFNPEAVGQESPPPPGELPFAVDPRQMSLFGAGWTVGSIHALARAGASSVTLYETTGWRGVMETEAGSLLPKRFASFPGGVFPLYHPLVDLAGSRAQVLASESNRPLDVEALALRLSEVRTRLLVVNHTGTAQAVRLVDLPGSTARVRMLDLGNVERAMRVPDTYCAEWHQHAAVRGGRLDLKLEPYAVATLDLEA